MASIDCLEGIDSIPVQGYEVIYRGEAVHIPYPEQASGRDKPASRPEGRSFHHGRFVQRLRDAARKTPNVSVVEAKVTELATSSLTGQVVGVECETPLARAHDGKTNGHDDDDNDNNDKGAEPPRKRDFYFAQLTVVADGYASKFRRRFVPRAPQARSKFYGLELRDVALPRPLHGHVVLSEHAPVLLYQIGSRETRALVDVPERLATAQPAAGGVRAHLRQHVLPTLPPAVQPAFAAALDRSSGGGGGGGLRSMPNSFLPPSRNRTPGLILVGDALNMRHPLTGGGMTVALNDAVLLAELLHPRVVPRLDDTSAVLRQMAVFHWRRKHLTSVINILAQALYALFAANGKLPFFLISFLPSFSSALSSPYFFFQLLLLGPFPIPFLSPWSPIEDYMHRLFFFFSLYSPFPMFSAIVWRMW